MALATYSSEKPPEVRKLPPKYQAWGTAKQLAICPCQLVLLSACKPTLQKLKANPLDFLVNETTTGQSLSYI